MYSLEEIFLIASNDRYASKMNSSSYESSMLYGIKIVKDETTSEIQIFSTYGDHYKEIDKESYAIFLNNGWRYGVYVLSLVNYCANIDKLGQLLSYQLSLGTKMSKKSIMSIMEDRDYLMEKKMEVTIKFNNLKSNQK